MIAALKIIPARVLYLLTFALATILWMNTKINSTIFIDNDMFLHALDHTSLLSFLHTRYMTWSGRIFIEAALAETLRFPLFWKLLIPSCTLLLTWSIWSVTLRSVMRCELGIPVVTLLFLFLPKEISSEAIYWLAGFYNYLLPISLAFFSISIFIRHQNSSHITRTLSLIALPIACSIEQSALLLLICTVVVIARTHIRSTYSKAYLVISVLLSAILFLAPGNRHRYFAEIGNWMPDYPRLDTLQKMSLAVDRIHRICVEQDNLILLVALIASILFLALKRGKRTVQDVLAMAIMALNALFILPESFGLTRLLDVVRCNRFLFDLNWAYLNTYLAFFLTLAMLASLFWCTLFLTEAAATLSVLGSALCITMLTGFSPTIYASSDRILFLLEIALVFYSCSVFRDLIALLFHNPLKPHPNMPTTEVRSLS